MKHGGSSHSKQKEKYGKLLKVQDLSLWQTGGLSLNMLRKIQAIKQRSFSAWNFMYFHVGSPGLRCFQSSGFPPLYKQKDTAAAS